MSEWHQELRHRLGSLGLSPERELELVEELAQHLDDHVNDQLTHGATLEEARASAVANLDGPGELGRRLAKSLQRSPLRLPPPGAPSRGRWLEARWDDLRYSVRSLRRAKSFTATVLVTLGLTIGPTTAMLSLGNWLLWRPTPGVSAPERMGQVSFEQQTKQSAIVGNLSLVHLDDLRRGSKTLDGISGTLDTLVNVAVPSLLPREERVGFVSADFFATLGVAPLAGRIFRAEDDEPLSGAQPTVISETFARRAFGSAHDSLGQRVVLNGLPMTVVGVLPAAFVGTNPLSAVHLWCPGASYDYVTHAPPQLAAATRARRMFSAFIVRLAPAVSFADAQAELDVLLQALVRDRPDDNKALARVQAKVSPGLGLPPGIRGRYESPVRILLGIGAVLLLLGCANTTNLLLMRAVRTQRERAVRVALGASGRRLVWLQVTESAVLALGGAGLGVVLALYLKEFIAALLVPVVATWPEFAVPLDFRVLAMTTGIAMTCGVVAGLVPAFVGLMTPARSVLGRSGGRSVTGARRLRAGLAVVQLALSLALVTGALLLVATLRGLWSVDLGFQPDQVTSHRLDAGRQGYSREQALAYYRDLFERLRRSMGDTPVALAATPYGSSREMRLQVPGGTQSEPIRVRADAVTPRYFEVVGMRLVIGRLFSDQEVLNDPASSPPWVIINEALARRAFGTTDPLGMRLTVPGTSTVPPHDLTVIGVANDARWNVTSEPIPEAYLPLTSPDYALSSAALVIRSAQPLQAVADRVDAAASDLDPTLPIRSSSLLGAEVANKLRERTTFASVLSMLGWSGLLLAAIGVYGILSQAVAERTREFGIRLAVGSGRARIFWLVIRQAAWIGTLGTAAGVSLAVWGSRLIESQLFGVTRTAPDVYAVAVGVLLTVVFLAGLWPARAATRVQPVEALRLE